MINISFIDCYNNAKKIAFISHTRTQKHTNTKSTSNVFGYRLIQLNNSNVERISRTVDESTRT